MSPSFLQAALPQGTQLTDYRLDRPLGRGGFAFTYLGIRPDLRKRVAIKELFPEIIVQRRGTQVFPKSNDPETMKLWNWALTKFQQEARILASFHHENIVRVNDLIQANNTAYIVMDYVDGQPLDVYLKSLKQAPSEAVLRRLLDQMLDGLECVHRLGVLHRDIKPGNIYLTSEGRVILLDFGAARPDNQPSSSFTTIRPYTDGYSPMEQYQTISKITPATDIYSAAATMVRAITGKTPPRAFDRSQQDNYVPLARTHSRHYSLQFLSAIDAGLAFRAQDRPQSIAQWRQLFGNAPHPKRQQQLPPPVSPPRPTPLPPVPPIPYTEPVQQLPHLPYQDQPRQQSRQPSYPQPRPKPQDWARPPARPASNTGIIVAIVGSLVACLIALVAVFWSDMAPSQGSSSSSPSVAISDSVRSAFDPSPQNPSPRQPKPSVVDDRPDDEDEDPAATPNPPASPPVAATPKPSPSPSPPTTPSAVPSPPAPSPSAPSIKDDEVPPALLTKLDAWTKQELEVDKGENPAKYAPTITTNDTGRPADTRNLGRNDLIREEIADNAKFTLNKFTHMACTSIGYVQDKDLAEVQQLFTYERRKSTGEWYLGIQIRILSIQNASTTSRTIQKRIVTAKAPGYRCHLSAADHQDASGNAIASTATTNADFVRQLIKRDRDNFETGNHRDSQDTAFKMYESPAARKQILNIDENHIILIPANSSSITKIQTEEPVVDVFPEVDNSAIVIRIHQ